MNLTLLIKLLYSLLAVFFTGYTPVYFLFEFKKNSNNANSFDGPGISRWFFIFFISIYLGFFIISNYLILLSLLNIRLDFFSAAILSLVFCIAFIFIRILEFKKTRSIKFAESFSDSAGSQKGSQGRDNDKNNQKEENNKFNQENFKGRAIDGGNCQAEENNNNSQKNDNERLIDSGDSQAGENNSDCPKEKSNKISTALQAVFAFLIFINFCVVSFFTFLFPIRFWDAISCWSLKGWAFFIDASVIPFYTQHQYTFTHLTYPLYISLSQTWIYIWLGEINETLVKVIFPLFYLSLIFIVYYLLRKEIKRLYAVISVFILSTLPVIMDHGYLEYTNLIFSVILLLGVYYFYVYFIKMHKNLIDDNLQNQNFQNHPVSSQPAQEQNMQNQPAGNEAIQPQAKKQHYLQNQSTQNQPFRSEAIQQQAQKQQSAQNHSTLKQALQPGQNMRYNLKNLIIPAAFFTILTSIRSEGLLFLIIFLLINTVYSLAALSKRLSAQRTGKYHTFCHTLNHASSNLDSKKEKPASDEKFSKTVDIKDAVDAKDAKDFKDDVDAKDIKEQRSKMQHSAVWVIFSIMLPVSIVLFLLVPWIVLQSTLHISGASAEWLPIIAGLKGGLKNIAAGGATSNFNEILPLFNFKNAFGALAGEFLFSKFDSARAFLGSSYGVAWAALAVMAAFNFKKLFKAFNWVFFVFLSAGFIALFISLGFIAEFAWSTERYMLHLFPLAYFWVISSYYK